MIGSLAQECSQVMKAAMRRIDMIRVAIGVAEFQPVEGAWLLYHAWLDALFFMPGKGGNSLPRDAEEQQPNSVIPLLQHGAGVYFLAHIVLWAPSASSIQ
jgi:hypothetical protein